MFELSIENGIIIKEVSAKEYTSLVKGHFGAVFNNRANDHIDIEIDSESSNKINQRGLVPRYMLRLVALKDGALVGWHLGFERDSETYYMQNSAVIENYRNQGIYSELLNVVLEKVRSEGFQVVVSAHHPHNTAVLIPKLKCGFFISGMQFHERFRSIVELKFIFNEERRKFHFKCMGLEL